MSGPGLESVPIMEALVLNCAAGLNLGLLLNNIWTWLAVMTAAVGFWWIRSLKPDLGPSPDPAPAEKGRQQPNHPVEERTAAEPDQSASTWTRRADELAYERVTKGNKYKAYYYSMQLEERENDGGGGWEGGDTVVVEEWRSESAAGRMDEMGWYSYQDRRVLDGSVVRLWDHPAARGGCSRGRRCRGSHALPSGSTVIDYVL